MDLFYFCHFFTFCFYILLVNFNWKLNYLRLPISKTKGVTRADFQSLEHFSMGLQNCPCVCVFISIIFCPVLVYIFLFVIAYTSLLASFFVILLCKLYKAIYIAISPTKFDDCQHVGYPFIIICFSETVYSIKYRSLDYLQF